MGRPVGSRNKPKQQKATPSTEFLNKPEPVQEAPQEGVFRIGRMIGTEWGVYACSKFGGKPVLVFIAECESDAKNVCMELNETVLYYAVSERSK